MKPVSFVFQTKKKRTGVILILMLLVVVLLGVAIWMGPSLIWSSDSDPNLPWNEEFRLLKSDQEPAQYHSSQQPNIEKLMLFKSYPTEGDISRGEITITLRPNGRIGGGWSGDFNPEPHLEHAVLMAGFNGNIDPSKIYRDEQGQDLSKLYFIAKGALVILETNTQTGGNRRISGYIYVTGWIDPKYTAVGKITITSDKKNFKVYTWQKKGIEKSSIFNF